MPVNRRADVGVARAAIRFIYTGKLEREACGAPEAAAAGSGSHSKGCSNSGTLVGSSSSSGGGLSIPELLAVRRQACFMQIGDCVGACDKELCSLLAATGPPLPPPATGKPAAGAARPSAAAAGRVGASGGTAAATAATADAAVPPVLQLYADESLLPLESEEPDSFKAVLAAAHKALVAHFTSAPTTLNSAVLTKQLEELPVAAMEALLASDSFSTDDESSVLLLLAKWRAADLGNRGSGQELKTLCALVRLSQLGPVYLRYILPEQG